MIPNIFYIFIFSNKILISDAFDSNLLSTFASTLKLSSSMVVEDSKIPIINPSGLFTQANLD